MSVVEVIYLNVHANNSQQVLSFFVVLTPLHAGNGEALSIGEIIGIVFGIITSITAIIGVVGMVIGGIAKGMRVDCMKGFNISLQYVI